MSAFAGRGRFTAISVCRFRRFSGFAVQEDDSDDMAGGGFGNANRAKKVRKILLEKLYA